MRRPPLARATLALCLAAATGRAQTDTDEQRSAWSHSRDVQLPPQRSSFVALALPPELLARCRADLADLRLVSGDGQEHPHLIARDRSREVQTRWSGTLVDSRREGKRSSSWTVDLGAARTFDTLLLTIPEQDFAKALRVEASADGAAWRELLSEAGVFDRRWTTRLHHTRIDLREPATARYLRLTADDQRSRPVSVTGLEAMSVRPLAGFSWSREPRLTALAADRGRSRYTLAGIEGLPFETLTLSADDPAFSRRVRLLESAMRNGRHEETVLGEAELYRVRVEEASLAVEATSLGVRPPGAGELVLEVRDDDSPPLRRPRVTVSAAATRLIFPWTDALLRLYYGNSLTRPPRYDLESQATRIAAAGPFPAAQLGKERGNQRFRTPPPLGFTPARGAALEARRWFRERALLVSGREDLYTLALQAPDLAALRPDLADLRVVDESDSQVPFLVETAVATAQPLRRIEASSAAAASAGRGRISRYRLTTPELDGEMASLPLSALELDVREGFFSRPARLLDPEREGRRGRRVIAATTLARSGRDEGPRAPLLVALDGRLATELVLEIDEGDDAPLTLEAARGVVRVPRVVFKAAPGRYRLLLGNPEAAPARYDIVSLRREFLAYSAVPIEAGPLARNAGHRRRASDYLKGTPPTLLLWGTLALAVVALLALTARILRQPAPPAP